MFVTTSGFASASRKTNCNCVGGTETTWFGAGFDELSWFEPETEALAVVPKKPRIIAKPISPARAENLADCLFCVIAMSVYKE
jgi:hypothetical protein